MNLDAAVEKLGNVIVLLLSFFFAGLVSGLAEDVDKARPVVCDNSVGWLND